MGIETIYIPRKDNEIYNNYLNNFKKYEELYKTNWESNRLLTINVPNDISMNTINVPNDISMNTINVPNDISMNTNDISMNTNDISMNTNRYFTYFDKNVNVNYKIILDDLEFPGDSIVRHVGFINPPFNINFLNEPSFNLNDFDDQTDVCNIYNNFIEDNLIYNNAYYRIEDITFSKVEKPVYYTSDSNILNNTDISSSDISSSDISSSDISSSDISSSDISSSDISSSDISSSDISSSDISSSDISSSDISSSDISSSDISSSDISSSDISYNILNNNSSKHITNMSVYISIYETNDIELITKNKMLDYKTITIENFNKNDNTGTLWNYAYELIKSHLNNDIITSISNEELFSYLDISFIMKDV